MTITRVEKLVYGVEDMETGANYYRDWGVEEVESGPECTIFRTRTNQTIELRPADDPSLPPSPVAAVVIAGFILSLWKPLRRRTSGPSVLSICSCHGGTALLEDSWPPPPAPPPDRVLSTPRRS